MKRAPRTPARKPALSIPWPWNLALLAIIVLVTALIRIRVLGIPLERDEGEYAYAGQLILQGIPPYALAYNMKFPGTYGAYAAVMALFGQSTTAVHVGLLLVNAAAIVLVYLIGRRLFNAYAGIVAAVGYALLSTSESVLGYAAHATHFVILPALGGGLLLLSDEERPRAWTSFWSGMLLGLALLMKQHGAVFVLFGLFYVVTRPLRGKVQSWTSALRHAALLALGAALPFAAMCLALARAGVFERFWFWTFSYAREYAAETPLREAWLNFSYIFSRVSAASRMLWVLAGLGVPVLWAGRETRRQAWFVTGLLLFGAVGLSLGLYFREHYFVLVLPAISLLLGGVVFRAANLLAANRFPYNLAYAASGLLFLVPFGLSVDAQKDILFELAPMQVYKRIYGLSPSPEAIEIGRYISAHTKPTDRIAVLGSEPEIYFYSHRHSATGYIYTYGLMESQPYARRMQEEMIREIEAARPAYLVFVEIKTSWLAGPGSETLLFDWYHRYQPEHYDLAGIVDIPTGEPPVYRWDSEVQGYAPRSTRFISIYRRRA
jgi:hypothetical protein